MRKIVSFQELMSMQSMTPEFSFMPDLCVQGESSSSLRYMQADAHILSCYKENATCEVHYVNAARLDIHNVPSRLFEKYFFFLCTEILMHRRAQSAKVRLK